MKIFCRIIPLVLATILVLSMFPLIVMAKEDKDGYLLGDFNVNGTTAVSLGTRFKGKIKFEYDLHIKSNITSSNNAIVFGGDGLSAWAGVGPALYINSSWEGSEDVFYTQNATGNSVGSVHNSTLTWKNREESGIKKGYTTYKVEQIIDTQTPISNGYGIYQIYITPHGGERTLITTGKAPGTDMDLWHGFRTSYTEITKIGVWTNGGTDILVTDLKAWYLDGDLKNVIINHEYDGDLEKEKEFLWPLGETFTYKAKKTIKKDDTTYYLVTKKEDLSKKVTQDGLTINVKYSKIPPEYEGEKILSLSLDGESNDVTIFGNGRYTLGQSGNSLYLDGQNTYAKLPNGMMSTANNFTILGYFKADSFTGWERIFDFGYNTNTYMFFSPYSQDGKAVFGITVNGGGGEQKITIPSPFTPGMWHHFAITLEDNEAILYVDGVEVGKNESMTLNPSILGFTNNNFLGKSQYQDPNFKGNIDEFEIYTYALRQEDIIKSMEEKSAKVLEIEEIELYTDDGLIQLPTTVDVIYENGLIGKGKVTWSDYEMIVGTFIVEGTINLCGKTYKTYATITYGDQSIIDDYKVTGDLNKLNDSIMASYTIESKAKEKVNVFLALYDTDGLLYSVKTKTININGGSENFAVTIPLPSKDGEFIAKSFLWKDNMEPISHTLKSKFNNQNKGFFEIKDVKLLDGIFLESQNTGLEYLLSLDADRLIAPYYEAANLTPKKARYGGWESMQISGHSLGHYLSAISIYYSATGLEEVKERVNYIIDELSYIQKIYGNGYIGGVEETPFKAAFSGNFVAEKFNLASYWVPWYNIHKTYQGLIDAYLHTQNIEALNVVKRFANWAKVGTDNLNESQMQKMLNTEHGGMNDVFAQLYEITQNENYLHLAKRFTHKEILDPLSKRIDMLTGYHANTQIPKVIGAAEIYENDENMIDYKIASEFFFETVVKNRTYVFGGNSNSEHFESLGAETIGIKTAESCNTHNMLKLTEHLYLWNQNKEYMDYFENALFNHILGTQDPLTGHKTYFTSTLPGHYRIYGTHDGAFWCCTGSGFENPARYAKGIYFKENDNLYVNLFISSLLNWKDKGMKIKQETNIPYDDTVKITIEEGEGFANLKIRNPHWAKGEVKVYINGALSEIEQTNRYITISRQWKENDEVLIYLPMELEKYTSRDNPNKIAFTYGPVVLAAALGNTGLPNDTVDKETGLDSTTVNVPILLCEDKDILDVITLLDKDTLTFKIDQDYTSNKEEIILKPFSDIHHEFYNVYWFLNEESGKFEKALNDITIDSVSPDGQQDEIGHNMKSHNSNFGTFVHNNTTYRWRDAWGSADAYFSYDLKVDGNNKNYLYVSFWGSDTPFAKNGINYTRDFQILVDDTIVGEQIINNNSPGNPFYRFIEIPEDLTKNKEKVTVKFKVKSDTTCAGGVLEVRTTNNKL